MGDENFAVRIRERYPEGLTGVFAIGGTRTAYILEQNRQATDPGRIEDLATHARYLMDRYWQLIGTYFELGGQNMIITASSFRGFSERGSDYATFITRELKLLIDDASQEFYQSSAIDPYFVGVDTLLTAPAGSPVHGLGQAFKDFQKGWAYQAGRPKLIWEIASIPLYSFWKITQAMSDAERAALDAELAAMTNMDDMHKRLYQIFSCAVYGTDVPMPHFYLGTNKSGDLKWRSPMPISLTGGEYLRLFYTPYPSLFMRRETLKAILEDMAFKERFQSLKLDYSGRYTPDLVQAEYERVVRLSEDPEVTVGLSRRVTGKANSA